MLDYNSKGNYFVFIISHANIWIFMNLYKWFLKKNLEAPQCRDPIQMFLGTAQRSDSLILFFCSAFNLAFNQRVLPSKLINLYKKFNPRRHIRVQDRTFMIEWDCFFCCHVRHSITLSTLEDHLMSSYLCEQIVNVLCIS